MATNKYIIQLIVETGTGQAKVQGVAKAFEQLENSAKRVTPALKKAKEATDGMGGAAGIAGATAAELGRTISDLPYGINAVTNNISQLGSMFALLVSSSNGVSNAIDNVGKVLSGPAGLLLLFQGAVAAVDFLTKSFDKNAREAKKNKEELQELNATLMEQQLVFNELSRIGFEYSEDVAKLFARNLKEVGSYLSELQKEGPITEEIYNAAIEQGNNLLKARMDQAEAQQRLINHQKELNRLEKEEPYNKKAIQTETMRLGQARLDLTESIDAEAKAMEFLGYQAIEEVIVEGKLNKAKKDTNKTRSESVAHINARIAAGLNSVKALQDEIEARQYFEFMSDRFNEDAQDKYLAFLQNLARNEALSFQERARYQTQYNALKQSLANEEVRIEIAKQNAIAQQRMSELDIVATVFNTIGAFSEQSRMIQAIALVGESAAGIAKIIINTKAANAALTLQAAAFLPLAPALEAQKVANNIAAAAGIAANVSSTATALNALKAPVSPIASTSIGQDGGGTTSLSALPAFNVVGSSTSQLAQILGAQGQQPIKTYVVAGEVSSAQSLERNRVKEASI
jgi:hypothetical protein